MAFFIIFNRVQNASGKSEYSDRALSFIYKFYPEVLGKIIFQLVCLLVFVVVLLLLFFMVVVVAVLTVVVVVRCSISC